MPTNVNGWVFRNLQIQQTGSSARQNYSCGIFLQAPAYAPKFENVDVMNLWGGIIEAPPASNNSSYFAYSPDTGSFSNVNLKFDTIPLVWYNGQHRTVNGLSIYGGNDPFTQGLYWFSLQLGSNGLGTASASIGQYYDECWTSNSGEHARFDGIVSISGGSLGQCGGQSYVNWLGNSGTVAAQMGIGLHVLGSGNTFTHVGLSASSIINSGQGNRIEAEDRSTSPDSSIPGTPAYRNRPYETVNKLDAGFLVNGNGGSPFTSSADLIIPCDEFNFAFQTATTPSGCTSDPNGPEITQSYAHLDSTNYAGGLSMAAQPTSNGTGPYGKYLIAGDRLPRTRMKMLVHGRCGAASCSGQTWKLYDYNGTTNTLITQGTLAFGTDWTTQNLNVDLSAIPQGDRIGVYGSNLFNGGATYFDLAYIAFQPYNNDVIAETVTSPLTSVATGGSININAANWAYGSTSNTGSPDLTSPVGYSTTIASSNSLAQWNGQTTFYAGYGSSSILPPVASSMAYLVQAPAVISDTLATAQTAAATSINVANAQSSWSASGCFQVDQEIECFTGNVAAGATSFTVARGQYGTLAQAHASGTGYTSVGTGTMQTLCNGTVYSSIPVVFGPQWNWFRGALAAQSCSGLPMTIGSLTGTNGPTGQTYKIAAIHIAPQPTLTSPTIEGTANFTGNTITGGFVSGKFMMGSGTMTLSAGSGAGSSPSISCAPGHVCDGVSGTVTLTTGAGPTTGTLATLSFPSTHSNQANCVVATTSSTSQLTSVTWNESTSALTLTAQSALAANTAYTIRYWCGGN